MRRFKLIAWQRRYALEEICALPAWRRLARFLAACFLNISIFAGKGITRGIGLKSIKIIKLVISTA